MTLPMIQSDQNWGYESGYRSPSDVYLPSPIKGLGGTIESSPGTEHYPQFVSRDPAEPPRLPSTWASSRPV